MAAHIGGSDKMSVQFRSPAPIFKVFFAFVLLSVCFCASGKALLIADDTVYSLGSFDTYYHFYTGSASALTDSTRVFSSATNTLSGTGAQLLAIVGASGSASGTFQITGGSTSYLDLPNPSRNSIEIQWYIPYSAELNSYLYNPTVAIYINTGSTSVVSCTLKATYSNGRFTVPTATSGSFSIYNSYVLSDSSGWFCHAFITLPKLYGLAGFGVLVPRPSTLSGGSWSFDMTSVKFIVSSKTFNVPNGGSSGSTDLSPVISDIASLSAQMTAEFNTVNQNISNAQTTISDAIYDEIAANETNTQNIIDSVDAASQAQIDNFNDWDDAVSDSYTSSDSQLISDANSTVDDLHTFETDQIDTAHSMVDDAGISSYELPSEVSNTFTEIGSVVGLVFNALPFISDLLLFSLTFGIASVLIGRKSRGAGD